MNKYDYIGHRQGYWEEDQYDGGVRKGYYVDGSEIGTWRWVQFGVTTSKINFDNSNFKDNRIDLTYFEYDKEMDLNSISYNNYYGDKCAIHIEDVI